MVKRKADVLEQKSPAEFFAENKNIAGFDNVCLSHLNSHDFEIQKPAPDCKPQSWSPLDVLSKSQLLTLQPGKCLYTTVRELVENALDSAESIDELPQISIIM